MKNFLSGLRLLASFGVAWTATAPAHAQAPAWQTVQAVAVATGPPGSQNGSIVRATAPDGAGNVYVAGTCRGTVALGNLTLASANPNPRTFVAKWLPASGTYAWAVQGNGPQDYSQATALAVRGSSVYVAGLFVSDVATFGATTLTNASPAGSQKADVYVARITDAGASASFDWALRAGGLDYDYPTAVAVSGANVYVAGLFAGATATFGGTTLANAGNGTSGGSDMFVAKLTDAGTSASFGWAQRAGTAIDPGVTASVAVNGSNVYVAGSAFAPVTVFGSPAPVAAGGYVARLRDNGNSAGFGWVAAASSPSSNYGVTFTALALGSGGVYVTGYFSGTASFGSTTLTSLGSTPANSAADIFVAKLTDSGTAGTFAWATRAGGPGTEFADALAVNGSGVYVTGSFDSRTAAFGGTTLTNSDPNPTGPNPTRDAFVARLTDAGGSGPFAWAKSAGGPTGGDYAFALALSGGRVFVGGGTENATASFAPLTLTNPTGSFVGFLASLPDPTLTAARPALAGPPPAVYPNPAHGRATVRWPAGSRPAPLVLLDALGRAVRRYPAPAGNEATLDLRGLPAGVYVLRHGTSSQRLVLE